jgi:hypothetical protein
VIDKEVIEIEYEEYDKYFDKNPKDENDKDTLYPIVLNQYQNSGGL